MTKEERAYRRGCLQAVQFLRASLYGTNCEDMSLAIAEFEQELIACRDSEDVELLGTYLDVVRERIKARSTQVVVPVGHDDLCRCDCSDKCPLGRMGMEMRCTVEELLNHDIKLARVT